MAWLIALQNVVTVLVPYSFACEMSATWELCAVDGGFVFLVVMTKNIMGCV